MRRKFFISKSESKLFVGLDIKKCVACWKCIDVCSKNVIGRINLPWHKHAKFIHSSLCIGCMKCVKVCTANAIVNLRKSDSDEKVQ